MSRNLEKVDLAFDFFSQRLKDGRHFTLDTLAEYTGWGLTTVKTYATKRWTGILKKNDGAYHIEPSF